MEVTCVISAVFETFFMVILWLQHGTVVRADLKPHIIWCYLLVSSTFPRQVCAQFVDNPYEKLFEQIRLYFQPYY
jgi:hypothetical protein